MMCKYDIIILAGQSNAEGNGRGGKEMQVPNVCYQLVDINEAYTSDDLFMQNYLQVTLPVEVRQEQLKERGQEEHYADLTPAFVSRYVSDGFLSEDRKLLVVKTAVGGSGFAKKQWGRGNALSDRLIQMVDKAIDGNGANRVVALLWHQGEHDVFEQPELSAKERSDFYCDKFYEQMQLFRSKYGEFPIITGGFVDQWADTCREKCDAIEKALQDSCKKLGKATFVSSKGLLSNDQATSNGDDIHFCRQSIYELGDKYYDAYKQLISK